MKKQAKKTGSTSSKQTSSKPKEYTFITLRVFEDIVEGRKRKEGEVFTVDEKRGKYLLENGKGIVQLESAK